MQIFLSNPSILMFTDHRQKRIDRLIAVHLWGSDGSDIYNAFTIYTAGNVNIDPWLPLQILTTILLSDKNLELTLPGYKKNYEKTLVFKIVLLYFVTYKYNFLSNYLQYNNENVTSCQLLTFIKSRHILLMLYSYFRFRDYSIIYLYSLSHTHWKGHSSTV